MTNSQSAPRLQVVSNETSSPVNSNVPEAMFISALLSSGRYTPDSYGIRDGQFMAMRMVHEFCRRYQEKANEAPPVHLVAEKYPSFIYTPDVSPAWAAHELHQAWKTRQLHKAMANAGYALQEDQIDSALSGLRTALGGLTSLTGKGSLATDLTYLEDQNEVARCPVSLSSSGIAGGLGALQRATDGIAPGHLWYIAARMGVGKSWRLLEPAVAAAEANWPVIIHSLEMPTRTVKDRIHRIALRNTYSGHWDDITVDERRTLLEQWSENAADIEIHDQSDGPCDASVVAAAADTGALVIIDYVGLMHTTSGQRSMEDWRAASIISNELKAAALEHDVPVISAAQVNRTGDSVAEPSTVHLAQSDALGQDADLVLTLRPYSRRVLLNYLAKNRHGPNGLKWHSRFEPALGRFNDLTPDAARDLKDVDDELDRSQTE